MRRIGVLMGIAEDESQTWPGLVAFSNTLHDQGWVAGRNVQFDVRWGEADIERMQRLAKELVGLRPAAILAQSTQAVAALQRETKTIPIVFVVVSDPIGSGFVASLPRPGGNITGFLNVESSLGGKWIELLKEILPGASRAALIFHPDTAPYSAYYLKPFEEAARSQKIEPIAAPVHNDADIERTIAGLAGNATTGLVVMPDAFTATWQNLELMISAAARHRVPAIYPYRFMVTAGGLISYGIDTVDLYRRASAYIDRILKGAKPTDLPVQLPTRFELAVNLKTAKALGIELPALLVSRADAVVE